MSWFCSKSALQAHGQLVFHLDPQGPSWQAAFQSVNCQTVVLIYAISLRVQVFAFHLVELHEVPLCTVVQPVGHPLNGSTSLSCIRHSLWFCIICEFTEGAFHSIVQVINEMLNINAPSIAPWGTPLVTCVQLDFVPSITSFLGQLFRQFLFYLSVHLTKPCFVSLTVMGDSIKTLLKINISYWSYLPSQSSHCRRQ